MYIIGGAVAHKVQTIVESDRLLSAVARCSHEDTSELECYHSAINKNCPKMYSFCYDGMLSR